MLKLFLGPRDSLLCSFEKVGYGKLDFDSDLRGEFSSFNTPGMEDLRLGSTGDMEILEEVLSLVVDLRWEEVLCLSFRSDLSCLEASFFSRLLSGLFSRILEGMTADWHDAVRRIMSERLL